MKGMTGLSAPLAADFDLCVRPGPDANSCYVQYVCVRAVHANTSNDVCFQPPSYTPFMSSA